MEENYDCEIVQGGHDHNVWKHGCYNRPNDKPVLVTLRHPLSFLYATWRAGVQNRMKDIDTFEDFVFFSIVSTRENPILHEWSWWGGYWLWRGLQMEQRVCLAPWESLLEAPERTCNEIADVYGVEPDGDFSIVERRVDPRQGHEGGFDFIRRRELNDRAYLDHYTTEMLAFCKDRIDPVLLKEFDYEA